MSIRKYFENIADAIKDKNPNVTNVTPAEMPSAIRSIPSGSSTASGVVYDNTTSGLTASNVQDAIDEISSDLSEKATIEKVEVNLSSASTYSGKVALIFAALDWSKVNANTHIMWGNYNSFSFQRRDGDTYFYFTSLSYSSGWYQMCMLRDTANASKMIQNGNDISSTASPVTKATIIYVY